MTSAKQEAPTAVNDNVGGKNTGEDVEANFNTSCTIENALLKALIWCPARLVLDVASSLEEDDFFNEHARIVYRAILTVASDHDAEEYGDSALPPISVVNALRATGNYGDTIHHLMLSIVATGEPAPIPPMVHQLARYLRVERLRRALDTAGRELIAASQDSHDHILVAIGRTQHLQALARRAGVERQAGGGE